MYVFVYESRPKIFILYLIVHQNVIGPRAYFVHRSHLD